MSVAMTNAVHEKLSVRSPNPRGVQIAEKIETQLCEAEARALAAVSAKAENARAHNDRAKMVSTFMKEGERRWTSTTLKSKTTPR